MQSFRGQDEELDTSCFLPGHEQHGLAWDRPAI